MEDESADWRDCCCCWCIWRIIFVSSFARTGWQFPNDFELLFVWLFIRHWPSAVLLWFSNIGWSGCCVDGIVADSDDSDCSCCSSGLLSVGGCVGDDIVELDSLSWLWQADVAFFMPSKIRISNTFGGKSSTFTSTNTRHSGHRSSEWLDTITFDFGEEGVEFEGYDYSWEGEWITMQITSKHFRQNVCWQGSTFDELPSISKQMEHSSRSFSVRSSIILIISTRNYS